MEYIDIHFKDGELMMIEHDEEPQKQKPKTKINTNQDSLIIVIGVLSLFIIMCYLF